MGDYRELYVSRGSQLFTGYDWDRESTVFSFIGIPFDGTSSYRSGSRFAPSRIRTASYNLEMFSIRSSINMEKVGIYDEGDIAVVYGDPLKTIGIIEDVSREFFNEGRIPIFVGGEHIVTLGIAKALPSSTGIVVFDAHLDLRDEYLGYRYSHACVFKRVLELRGSGTIFYIGSRAFTPEELNTALSNDIAVSTIIDLRRKGFRSVVREYAKWSERFNNIYISIDIDALDPSQAPGVNTPEPDGVMLGDLLDMLYDMIDERVIGIDIVEVNPLIDNSDITSMAAAKIIIEASSYIYKRKRK